MKVEAEFFLVSALLLRAAAKKSSGNRVSDNLDLSCLGNVVHKNVSLAAFYPFFDENPSNYLDSHLKKLRTFEMFLQGQSDFITVGMDPELEIPYGTPVCIPELNHLMQRRLRFQVRSDGWDMDGAGLSRIDVCVGDEEIALHDFWNRKVTVVF